MAEKSLCSTCNEVTKKMSGDADPQSKYRSPLSARYASAEMSYHFSEQKKFFLHGENCGLGWRRQKRWAILHTAGGVRTAGNQCHWSAVVLPTGLCAKDTDTVTHIGTHAVSSQNKSVTESELGLNQSVTLSWGWDLEMKTNWQWQDWQRHAHGHDCRWYCQGDAMASL